MRRFLLPLIAAIALPTAANAESIWLILRYGNQTGSAMEKIKMSNMNQCELMGAKWMGTKFTKRENNQKAYMNFGYACIQGE